MRYQTLPSIVSMADAIAAQSFHSHEGHVLERGNLDVGFAESDVIIEGVCVCLLVYTHDQEQPPQDIEYPSTIDTTYIYIYHETNDRYRFKSQSVTV